MEYQITQSNLSLGKHKIKALKNGKKWKFGKKTPNLIHKTSSQKDHLALRKEHKLQQGGSVFHSAFLFCPCCTDIIYRYPHLGREFWQSLQWFQLYFLWLMCKPWEVHSAHTWNRGHYFILANNECTPKNYRKIMWMFADVTKLLQ